MAGLLCHYNTGAVGATVGKCPCVILGREAGTSLCLQHLPFCRQAPDPLVLGFTPQIRLNNSPNTRCAIFFPTLLVATDPAELALTQPELLFPLQERMAKYLGKSKTALTHLFFPITSLQLLPTAIVFAIEPIPCSQEDAEPHHGVKGRLVPAVWGICSARNNTACPIHGRAEQTQHPSATSCANLRARSKAQDLLFCNFLCNASESAEKSFSDSNNVSLQSSWVFFLCTCEVMLQACRNPIKYLLKSSGALTRVY